MSEITFLAGGGANSIGCSFYRLKLGDKYIGIDWGGGYGSSSEEPQYDGPLDYLLLSHGHYDHVGMVPSALRRWPDLKIFANAPTRDLCRLSWRQTFLRAGDRQLEPPFSVEQSKLAASSLLDLPENEPLQLGEDILVYAVNAGHILGSVSFVIVHRGEIYFFTNDICFRDRNLLVGAPELEMERCRLLVRESTYVNDVFDDRPAIEAELVAAVEAVMKPPRSGRVLIASLSVDRMQDAFSILNEAGVEPLYVDGGRAATSIYMKYLADKAQSLKKAFSFRGQGDRERLIESGRPAVVISSSGMVFPNTLSAMWAERFLYEERNAIFLINYQDPSGQGYALAESANGDFIRFNNSIIRRACEIKQFNLSAHMDKAEGERLEERLHPEAIIYTHGEDAKIQQYIDGHQDGKTRIKALVGKEVEL